MERTTVYENVRKLKSELSGGNAFGERVSIVAATKMQSPETINAAIDGGVDAIAENKVQEFRDKNECVKACPRHFIGHLQTNKVKYLIGKIELYHSCDRDDLAKEIARLSLKNGIISDVLIQINIGAEESKGGYAFEDGEQTFLRLSATDGLRVRGFMAMLPDCTDEKLLANLTDKMRGLFDWARTQKENIDYLSMGMSGDYRLCVEHGSNMIRVGSTLFGARDYSV